MVNNKKRKQSLQMDVYDKMCKGKTCKKEKDNYVTI
jgi:hypothetical protein